MAEKNKLFRKVSLERLSSPEELDQVLRITTPKGWIALLTLGGLIIMGMIWGIFGSIPTKVSGMGLFVNGEGVKDISAPTWGQITTVYVAPGEFITRGQMVARVAQPELITEISQIRSRLMELEREKSQIHAYIESEMSLQEENNIREKKRISNEILNLRDQIRSLEERKENQKILLEKGLITRQQYLTTQVEIKSLEQRIVQLSNQKMQIPLGLLQLQEEHEQRIRNKEMQISDAERNLAGLEERLEEASKIYSPHSGRIFEVSVAEGTLVNSGTRIASLELAGAAVEDLVAVLYLPAEEGKKVKPGMNAHLSPTTVRVEEDGAMQGLVTSAGDFPATQEGMMRIVRNELLVRKLSQGGSPIEIFVSPIPSPDTVSGYKWTSSGGPDQPIHSGTITQGSIIIDKQAPISLVIPWLKKHVLGVGFRL